MCLGQIDRQVLGPQGADAAVGPALGVQFVQDGKRLAPEVLPAEEPIAEFVVHRRAAQALGLAGRRRSAA